MRIALFTCAAVLISCAHNGKETASLPSRGLTVQPPDASIFLRASFDADASSFIGRFVPNELGPGTLDENRAAQTRCSEFIGYEVVPASGSFDEIFNTSTQAGASLGVLPVGSASAATSAAQALRVKYELRRKLRSVVKDPAGLDRCCKAAPEQCSDRFIGEFLFGEGSVYQAVAMQDEAEASGMYQAVTAGVEYKDGLAWERRREFSDAYFAFRTVASRLGGAAQPQGPDDCSWANRVPTSLDGTYFVGMAAPAASEAQARDLAMRNAREQVVKFLGEYLTSSMKTKSTALEGYLEDEQVVTAVAEGLASRVKDERWCTAERIETPNAIRYAIKVLAFFPAADRNAAAHSAIETVEAKAGPKLTPAVKKELDALKRSLR